MLTRPTCFLFSVGGLYGSQAERWEALGLGACELVVMPHEDACKALATTSALERFELLLESLRRAVSELDALAALEAIGGLGGGGGAGGGGAGGGGAGGGAATGVSAGASARPSLLKGTTSFTPVDIPLGASPAGAVGAGGAARPADELAVGTRLEYWWDPELGWLQATVVRQLRLPSGELMHSLEFDMDGAWEDVSLNFDSGQRRWRPLSPGDMGGG